MSPAPRRPWRVPALALGAAAIFLVGLGLGDALDDGTEPGGTQTLIRTLDPLPLAPAARETVTVTVSKP